MRTNILIATALSMLGSALVTAQGDARFSVRSELVVLDVAVTNDRGVFVSSLPQDAFRVMEDGRLQSVSFFAEQDAPASIAILIDSSGSMLATRDRIIAGITSLAMSSHADDEFMPLVFNERVTPVLPQDHPFTSDPIELRKALTNNLGVRGRTAFHDALSAALDGLSRGRHERRALIVLSDGGDNASEQTFDEVLEKVQASNVVIYTIALLDPLSLDRNPGALRRLSEVTGGLAFEPKRAAVIDKTFRSIAADIRSRYTLAYEPSGGESEHRVRRVKVRVHAPGKGDMKVRTRTGYVTGSDAGKESGREDGQ
jgi:Ca-activated chloride channel homolog